MHVPQLMQFSVYFFFSAYDTNMPISATRHCSSGKKYTGTCLCVEDVEKEEIRQISFEIASCFGLEKAVTLFKYEWSEIFKILNPGIDLYI